MVSWAYILIICIFSKNPVEANTYFKKSSLAFHCLLQADESQHCIIYTKLVSDAEYQVDGERLLHCYQMRRLWLFSVYCHEDCCSKIPFEMKYHRWRWEFYCHKMINKTSFVRQCLCTAAAALTPLNILQLCDYLTHTSISGVR